MTRIRLLATDLDGTLIGRINEYPLYNNLRDRLEQYRRSDDFRWVACTGRSLRSFKNFFSPMSHMGLMPEYVIVNHAYIYEKTAFGYMPHIFWNLHIFRSLMRDRLSIQEAIDRWYRVIYDSMFGVKVIYKEVDRLCMRFPSHDAALAAAGLIEKDVAGYVHLKMYRYHMEIDIRMIPYTKGVALFELIRRKGFAREEVLAVGNGHNDISILNGDYAALTGCPSNSEPNVIKTVHESGGHIASCRALGGVLEILDAYENGTVNSAMPDNWAEEPDDSPAPRHHKHDPSTKAISKRRILIALLGAYVILMVLANYDIVPLKEYILKPLEWACRCLARVTGLTSEF